MQAQYASDQSLNGVFDSRFTTPRAVAAVEAGPYFVSSSATPTATFRLPAGLYDSVELDSWTHSYHWFWGADSSIAVRPAGTTTWNWIGGFTVGGTDGQPDGASVRHRFSLGWANDPRSDLEVLLSCGGYKGGECSFANLDFIQEMPGWRFLPAGAGLPSDQVYTGVYATTYQGLTPQNRPFFGIETNGSGGGGVLSA